MKVISFILLSTVLAASFISANADKCQAKGISNPRTCAEAVKWALDHISTADNPGYYDLCDHVAGLAYGHSASGFPSAIDQWDETPSKYKHPGKTDIPAGGLAFFQIGEYGHVAISIGGSDLISTDINGRGTYTKTTIGDIESKWGAHYLGWTNPWFH